MGGFYFTKNLKEKGGRKVKLYTTHCPKCRVIETKLKQKNIKYETIEDISIMEVKGFTQLPVLELDSGETLPFVEANKYINSLEAN